jgi:hypothetical protein
MLTVRGTADGKYINQATAAFQIGVSRKPVDSNP